jgi:hypothetical protein
MQNFSIELRSEAPGTWIAEGLSIKGEGVSPAAAVVVWARNLQVIGELSLVDARVKQTGDRTANCSTQDGELNFKNR